MSTPDPLDPVLSSLHPDCPDWQRLADDPREAKIRAAAQAQRSQEQERSQAWSKSFNRRRFLAGGLGVGVAALATQLVTSRVSYAAPGEEDQGTLVVIFLRGGLDGLSVVVPGDDPDLLAARPDIAVRGGSLLQMDRGFGLHPALAPLQPLIDAGQLAAVPAIATPDLSRSHFQAQDCLERGTPSAVRDGWLDRVLQVSGPGTTFRSLGLSGRLPRSLAGSSRSLALRNTDSLALNVPAELGAQTMSALETLYTGVEHPISMQTMLALDALDTMTAVRNDAAATASTVSYPDGNLGEALSTLAVLIKAKVGVRVACIDVGGWDMHTAIGTVDDGDMQSHLSGLAQALSAFTQDLGSGMDSTTILTMSEFGRRLAQNANSGTDHGHGGVLLAMGGGVRGGIHGQWHGLGNEVTQNGDVPGSNDYRDVLSEIVAARLGLGMDALGDVFPGWKPTALGVMA